MEGLYERLLQYGKEGRYPFHMPGHKRNPELFFENPFSWDITEIEGFDDLHHPQGILKEAMEEAAVLYGSKKTFFLVNGSSCGIQAAILAATKPGETILAARNCHKSVYHGILQGQLKAFYVYPQKLEGWGISGQISPEDVEKCLKERPETAAVVITSPTYKGVVSDVEQIAGIVHRFGAVLIVDEAHGAHFSFGGGFPASALEKGADIVVQSLHKTLPSLTQTALLHVGKNSRVSEKRLQSYLSIYESSSPSYVLLASVDRCIRYMAGEGRKRLSGFRESLCSYRLELKGTKAIRLLEPERGSGVYDYDPSKLYLECLGKGEWMAGRLRQAYGLEPEMADRDGVLLMTSFLDREEGFFRLIQAVKDMDELFCREKESREKKEEAHKGETVCQEKNVLWEAFHASEAEDTLWEAFHAPKEEVSLWESEGRISGEFIYLYPPGIPIVAPGERVTRACLSYLSYQAEGGASLKGMADPEGRKLSVLKGR